MMGAFLHGLLTMPVSHMETHLESSLQILDFLTMVLGSETLPNITHLFFISQKTCSQTRACTLRQKQASSYVHSYRAAGNLETTDQAGQEGGQRNQ